MYVVFHDLRFLLPHVDAAFVVFLFVVCVPVLASPCVVAARVSTYAGLSSIYDSLDVRSRVSMFQNKALCSSALRAVHKS